MLCTLLALGAAPAAAETAVAAPPAPLRELGRGSYTWWGLSVYRASLWVAPGFDAAALPRQRFALELHYERSFQGRDIAQRSIAEMRRVGPVSDAQAQAWLQAMQTVFPDVVSGDRLRGVHRPGQGAQFFHNGRAVGEIADPEFAHLFFGIWLSEQTAAPALRQALLGTERAVAR